LILNIPLIGLWIKVLAVPYRLLYPSILVFMGIGAYSLSNSSVDVLLMAIFGILGYVFIKLDCEPAPLLLGFILGPLMEENLRRAMMMSRGDATVFLTEPISAGFLIVAIALLGIVLAPSIRNKREEVFSKNSSIVNRESGAMKNR